jgi:hypothetical protein
MDDVLHHARPRRRDRNAAAGAAMKKPKIPVGGLAKRSKRDLGAAKRFLREYGGDMTLHELVWRLALAQPAGDRGVGRPLKWHPWHRRVVYLLVEELRKRHKIGPRQAWRRAAAISGDTIDAVGRYYVHGRALMQEPEPWGDTYDLAMVTAIAESLAEFSPRQVPQ